MRFKSILLGGLLLAASPAKALNIFACEPIYGSLAKAVAPSATVYNATSAAQDPHAVEARPSLISKLRRADVAICAGADLEVAWLPMLQLKAANSALLDGGEGMFFASEHIDTLDKHQRVTADMGDVHAKGNPHFHMDPKRLIAIAHAFADKLTAINGDKGYRNNAANLEAELLATIDENKHKISQLQGKQVAAYHSSFRYLYQFVGMKQIGDLEPLPGVAPSNAHLAKLLNDLNEQPVAAVVLTPYQSKDAGDWLANKLDAPMVILPMAPKPDQTIAQWFNQVITHLHTAVHNG